MGPKSNYVNEEGFAQTKKRDPVNLTTVVNMTYLGSKERIKEFILRNIVRVRAPGQLYIEPFMGSGSIISELSGPRIGSDAHKDLMLLWMELVNDSFEEPATITKEVYDKLMKSNVPSALRGYAGFFWSFSGMFDKGFSSAFYTKSHSFHKARETAVKLRDAVLAPIPYYQYIPEQWKDKNAVIYCDPPYLGTTGYKGTPDFDYERFYYWCEQMSSLGNTVLISEYYMPSTRFVIIDQLGHRIGLKRLDDDNDRIEFIYQPRV